MKRQFFILSLILMAATAMWAAPALRGAFTVTQADGTLLTIEQFGDEFFHWTETADGTLVVPTRLGYFVAVIDDKGELTASDVLAHEAQLRGSKEQHLVNQQATRRALFHQQGQRAQANRRTMSISVSNKYLPHAGSPRILTILAAYQDLDFIVNEPKLAFDQYLNGDEIVDFGNSNTLQLCSVRKYFNACSNGLFTPQFDVVGPVKLPQDMAYYGGKDEKRGSDDKFYQLCQDAYQAVKDSVADWSLYDNDNDGNVELVCIIFAGYGQNQGGVPETIWAKASRQNMAIDNNMRISFFNCCSELFNPREDYSQYINGTGTFIHEMSHCMGLPDLYQTTSDYANNQGMESWSIMDYGLYNRNGFAPAPYNAWEREVMGWSQMEPISAPTQVNLLKPWADGGTAYKIVNSSDDNEYIVMENIQKQGLNKYAKGHGLLVYHVGYKDKDKYKDTYPLLEINMTDAPNNEVGHPAVAVVPASGLLINTGLASDTKPLPYTRAQWSASIASSTFPGDSAVTELTLQQELPNYVFYSGDPLNVELHNITESEGCVSFDFVEAPVSGIHDVKTDAQGESSHSYYDLQGRRIANGQKLTAKGLYIHQGKKIVIH